MSLPPRDPFMTGSKPFSFDPTEFAGKRALVTGGTKGMGEAIVRRLAAGGARVATTARSPSPEKLAVEVFVQADISTREGVDKVIREVLDRLAGVDILVNNVGLRVNGSNNPGMLHPRLQALSKAVSAKEEGGHERSGDSKRVLAGSRDGGRGQRDPDGRG